MQTPLGTALLQAVPRDGLSVAADISIVIVAAAVVVLAIVLILVLARLSKVLVEIRNGVRTNLGPVAERSRGIAENVEAITRTVRGDVDKLTGSVTALTDRLKQASERMEERIEDFNALMEVVQEEAEDVFIDTAATVRGVRAGARSITRGRRAPGADDASAGETDDEPAREATADNLPADPESEPAGALAAEKG
jgi:uncharacterized protein YoxC